MSLENSLFTLLLIATCLMVFISYLSFRKRHIPVAKYTALVMLAASFYSLGYAFELISSNLVQVKLWLKFEYIGIPFISTFWFILVLCYTGHQAILEKRFLLLLFVIPVITFVLHYTNDLHHFFYRDIQMDDSGAILQVQLLKGPWYWVHISYNYLQAAVGMILFIVMYLKAMPVVRQQIMILMLGAAGPWLTNLIYLIGNNDLVFDLTPLGFTLSGLFYIWGIYRFNLLRLAPIALQTVFETMEDGVIILDYEYNITNVNHAAKTIFAELHDLNNHTTSAIDLFSNYPELLRKTTAPANSESRISFTINGEIRQYYLKIRGITDRGKTLLGRMLIFSDVTQVINYQEKLISNANQLAELSAFKDKLFTTVAHDIRDPLAVLIHLTELLEEELANLGYEQISVFQEVSGQVRNTFMLVEHLLDWYRSQQGIVGFNPFLWEAVPIVQRAVDSIKNRLDVKKIQITTNVQADLRVFADRGMLDLVLRNLLSNAVKFTRIEGYIHVEVKQEGSWVNISVRDSGIGIDDHIAKSLFVEVQQGSCSGTEGEKGTGLGLYLAGQFVIMNGGRIWFESMKGQGSTFFLTIPATSETTAGVDRLLNQELKAL